MTPTGLGQPPNDLSGFPGAGTVDQLHRLSEWPGVWWYSCVDNVEDPKGGRFDLVGTRGTCHLAEDSLDGALIEKLLRTPTKVVVAERLGELFHAVVHVRHTPSTADLTAAEATGYGINGEIHTTLNYATPRRWAAALYASGWRAVRHRLRGDPSQNLAGRALFGGAGIHARAPAGMTTTLTPLDLDQAERFLGSRGVEVWPIPTSVPILR